jgi:ABC-type transport system involved in multi-copper enzyme maturation permease subunit
LLEVPTAFLAGGVAVSGDSYDIQEGLGIFMLLLWLLAALIVVVKSSNSVVSERINQTLDVLLTTPIAGRRIVLDKLRGVRRCAVVLAVPMVTVILLKAWGAGRYAPPYYLILALVSLGIYLPMLSWVAMWIGLARRTRARATITALIVVTSWCVLPIVIACVLAVLTDVDLDEGLLPYVTMLSPASGVLALEVRGFAREVMGHSPLLVLSLSFLWHAAILLFVRRLCLRHADRYLGRASRRAAGVGTAASGGGADAR